MAGLNVKNTSADLTGKTLVTAEGDRVVTGLWTFNRGAGAPPIAVAAGAGAVVNLDADKVDGKDAAELLIPIGVVLPFAGAAAPPGYLLCDGSEVSQATYGDLFAVIGAAFNRGDEAPGNFRLPDLRGRAPIGVGAGAGLTARNLGDQVGAETHQLIVGEIPAHSHGVTDPGHNHGVNAPQEGQTGSAINELPSQGTGPDFVVWPGAHTATVTGNRTTGISIQNQGGGGAHPNMQPSLALNFIIRAA